MATISVQGILSMSTQVLYYNTSVKGRIDTGIKHDLPLTISHVFLMYFSHRFLMFLSCFFMYFSCISHVFLMYFSCIITENPDVHIKLLGNGSVITSPYGYQGLFLPASSSIQILEDTTFYFPRGFTIEAVVSSEADTHEVIFEDSQFGDSHFAFKILDDGALRFGVFRLSGYDFGGLSLPAITLSPIKVHYYAVVYEPVDHHQGEVRVYVDGQFVVSGVVTGELYHRARTLVIHGEDDQQDHDLVLYMLTVSDRPKPQQEITTFVTCK